MIWVNYNRFCKNGWDLSCFMKGELNLGKPNFGGDESHGNCSNKGAEAGFQGILKGQRASCLAGAQSS